MKIITVSGKLQKTFYSKILFASCKKNCHVLVTLCREYSNFRWKSNELLYAHIDNHIDLIKKPSLQGSFSCLIITKQTFCACKIFWFLGACKKLNVGNVFNWFVDLLKTLGTIWGYWTPAKNVQVYTYWHSDWFYVDICKHSLVQPNTNVFCAIGIELQNSFSIIL